MRRLPDPLVLGLSLVLAVLGVVLIASASSSRAVATLDPEGAPHTAQATTLECISPPGSHDTHWAIAAYMRSAMPVRSMISPIST